MERSSTGVGVHAFVTELSVFDLVSSHCISRVESVIVVSNALAKKETFRMQ